MKGISDLHHEAMSYVDKVWALRQEGQTEVANIFVRKAYECERKAAMLAAPNVELEPTRSVLCRSAASLALECAEFREAEKLISLALSGSPPEEIAQELRDLLEQVYFERHLSLRGITLDPNEFQVSMAGQAVGSGITSSAEFIDRAKNIESTVYRTGERLSGSPYREHGRLTQKGIELYVSAPRPSSFAISFRIGRGGQLKLPGMDPAQDIIDEIFECLELFNSFQTDLLSKKIENPAYYRNFVGLARNIAPDGEEIKTVGFTAVRNNVKRQVVLTTTRKQAPISEPRMVREEHEAFIKITGKLLFADARREKGEIQIVDDKGKGHRVRVPEGMMSDIVRPLWEYKVTVSGAFKDKKIHLRDIEKAVE